MLRIKLLGQFAIEQEDQSVVVQTRPPQALLAYLLLNVGVSQRREQLAGLLWPDANEANARNNLRHALWRIRKAIGHDYLLSDNVSVTFDANAAYWLDVAVLEGTIGEQGAVNALMEAVGVYGGELLPGFYDDWVILERERLQAVFEQQSKRLLDRLVEARRWPDVLHWGERWVALGQTPETAYRALMVAHAESGNQVSVAAVYQRCVDRLRDDLGVEPSQETQALYARLASGEGLFRVGIEGGGQERAADITGIDPASHEIAGMAQPAFLDDEIEPPALEQRVFVERTRELGQLGGFLEEALAGRGQVVFVTGGAGRGKTSLVNEFAQRAQANHAELLVASGNCNAYAGIGDPYLPFRDVMEMLTGAVEAKWMAGTITRQHARRLWDALPETIVALMDGGSGLIDTVVPGGALLARATAAIPSGAAWLARLQELTAQRQSRPVDLNQSFLFAQYANVLEGLAERHPLLIVLDDFQWADIASISLLFHLGRRFGSSRIMLVVAYRPEEVALGWDGSRHPLRKAVSEFKRTYGDISVELADAEEDEGRRFVDVLLDTEPNRLDEGFRQALYKQTTGHPLFTTELLEAMRARGDLVEAEDGHWVEGAALDWQVLPARVEAVIEERIGRLDAELHGILAVASAEGETFTPIVVAQVQGISQMQLLRQLSQELGKRHRLVREREDAEVGGQPLTRYRFSHILFQRYLYDALGSGERRHLHGKIADVLEEVYAGHTDEITARLLHHFLEAGVHAKAIEYARRAAARAEAIYAYDEAIQHLQTALSLLEPGQATALQLKLLEELADIHAFLVQILEAVSLYEAAIDLCSSQKDANPAVLARLQRKILKRVVNIDHIPGLRESKELANARAASRAYLDDYLARDQTDLPLQERVRILTTLAYEARTNMRTRSEYHECERYALLAVAAAEEYDYPVELSDALQVLSSVYHERWLLTEQLQIARRQLDLIRDPRFSDMRERIYILIKCSEVFLEVGEYVQAISHLLEAAVLAAEIGSVSQQVYALDELGRCYYHLDRWDEQLEAYEQCLALERRYSRREISSYCMLTSMCAAVYTLRGDDDNARVTRDKSYHMMVGVMGEEGQWQRNARY